MPSLDQSWKLVSVLCLTVLLGGCKTELYSNLVESDANTMLAILLNHDIQAEKKFDPKASSYILRVDEDRISQAVTLLKEQGYPREKVSSLGELFKKDGLVSSPLEERARFIFALSQSVQETLSQIDGVLVARVHVVLPVCGPWWR